jgi:hypothetical protein
MLIYDLPNLYSQHWVAVTRVTVVSVNRDHLIWTQLSSVRESDWYVYDFSGFESGGRTLFIQLFISKTSN